MGTIFLNHQPLIVNDKFLKLIVTDCDGSQSPFSARKCDREDMDVVKPSTADNDVII